MDVVGLDASSDEVDRAHIEGDEALLVLGKPFGFNEFARVALAIPQVSITQIFPCLSAGYHA